MILIPEQFNKLVTEDEFSEFKEVVNEKFEILISILEKSAKKEADHEIERVSNIVAHDRF